MTINNTELYNKALEAIDNFQPIFCRIDSGYSVVLDASWCNNNGNYYVYLFMNTVSHSIYPTSVEDDLYNPKNINPSAIGNVLE